MSRETFEYVTYVRTTPEQLWKALLDGETTMQYWWSHRNVSDWQPGSRWEHQRPAAGSAVDIVGRVVEFAPPRRLVLTWAFPADEADATKHSRVSLDIKPIAGVARLTVTHDDLEPDSEMLQGITEGWPAVLSSLKSLLETGSPLPEWD